MLLHLLSIFKQAFNIRLIWFDWFDWLIWLIDWFDWLIDCLFACLFDCLLACLLACLFACLLVCLLACCLFDFVALFFAFNLSSILSITLTDTWSLIRWWQTTSCRYLSSGRIHQITHPSSTSCLIQQGSSFTSPIYHQTYLTTRTQNAFTR